MDDNTDVAFRPLPPDSHDSKYRLALCPRANQHRHILMYSKDTHSGRRSCSLSARAHPAMKQTVPGRLNDSRLGHWVDGSATPFAVAQPVATR